MIKKGTLQDRINSLSELVKKIPSRGLTYISQMMKEARKSNKKHAEVAVFSLKELFVNHILKDNAKLDAFQHSPRIQDKQDAHIADFDLIDAYYNHCVKEMYREYVTDILTGFSKDNLEYFRKIGMDCLVFLISNKPELEELILGILINKLGDSAKKVQQHAIQVMCRLLKNQPDMATVVTHETHMLLLRPGLKAGQKYQAVFFLNKIALLAGKSSEKVRINLFKIYFYLFKEVMRNPEELKTVIFKKDRSKSKQDQKSSKIKALKKVKQIKDNGDIDESDNKEVEQILKGINILML
jgi:hypothetical protein